MSFKDRAASTLKCSCLLSYLNSTVVSCPFVASFVLSQLVAESVVVKIKYLSSYKCGLILDSTFS